MSRLVEFIYHNSFKFDWLLLTQTTKTILDHYVWLWLSNKNEM